MRTIVLAASKGGVGKTTLTAALAAVAAQSEKVAVIDLDPQQSLARWIELRQHYPGKAKSPVLFKDFEDLAAAVEKIRAQGYDWLFIDTPPALMTHILPAIRTADLVLIPATPSPLDVEAVEPIIEMCRDYKKNFEFILNMVAGQGAVAAGAIKYLRHEGKVLADLIASRQIYSTAMSRGRTAPEADRTGKATDEIKKLWKTVKADARRAKDTVLAKTRKRA
ncbi:AAA family ATPase [Hyphomicrobium sp. MC8b]|uniref:AAA family ATPase n=1 Tax=Hyphomicrobium sp. MC8b TaxID=300273 RepID=UPI00391BD307